MGLADHSSTHGIASRIDNVSVNYETKPPKIFDPNKDIDLTMRSFVTAHESFLENNTINASFSFKEGQGGAESPRSERSGLVTIQNLL